MNWIAVKEKREAVGLGMMWQNLYWRLRGYEVRASQGNYIWLTVI